MDNSDPCEEDMEVQVAQVSADAGDVPQHLAELEELQGQDSELGQIVWYVQEGLMPEDSKVKSCVLTEKGRFVVLEYYVDPARKDRTRLVVPRVLRQKLMEEMHSGGFAGHFAVKGLYEKLSRQYWWDGMYAEVYCFCKGCLTCAAYEVVAWGPELLWNQYLLVVHLKE